jgi:sugar diacid utilization regulator/GAF domain-containing protein
MTTETRHDEVRRWLAGVGTIAAAVNAPVELPALLDLIARTACELTGYEAAGVLLADDAEHALYISGSHGLSADYVARVNAEHTIKLGSGPLSAGPSSRAFRAAEPVAISDLSADPSFAPWVGVALEYGYRAIVAVPLLVGGRAAGTVNCYRTGVHPFGADEIDLLKTLANQAGIALETARLRDRERRTIDDLEQLNRSLTAQHRLLEQAEQIHRELTAVALRAGGVQAVADALARLLARPVLVADPAGQPLANAQHRGVLLDPAPIATAGDTAEEATSPLRDSTTGELMTAPVVLGDELVARLWIAGRVSGLGPLDRRAVEHAAVVCGLELLRQRTALEVEWRLRGDVLSDLLGGGDSAGLGARAESLGHDLTRPHSVLVVKADRPGGQVQQGAGPSDVRRLLGIAQVTADGPGPRPLVTSWGDYVVVLWPESRPGPRAEAADAAEAIRQAAQRALGGGTASAVVGRRCIALSDYASAFRIARGALELAQLRGGTNRTSTVPDLGVYGLLLQLEDPHELVRFADGVLAPLHHYDERKDLSLVATLRTYLEQGMSTSRTAAALFVHPNTIGLRLRRIEELIGVRLAEPEALLHVKAAFMAEDVTGSAWGSSSPAPDGGPLPGAARASASGVNRARGERGRKT